MLFTFTVRAGEFFALNQIQADRMAKSYACNQARLRRFCLSSLPTTATCGVAYHGTVTATGPVIAPCTWEITSGALPDGLTLGGFSPNIDVTSGKVETIQGIPTANGTFNFTLRCTGQDQSFMEKGYTITVSGCIHLVPTAYWTLNESAATTNRADSAGSSTLFFTGTTQTGVAALISNGVEFSGAFGGNGYSTAPISSLKHTIGNGFSLWGWVRCNSLGGSTAVGGPRVEYVMSAFEQIYIASGTANPDPQPFRINTKHDDAYISLSLGVFHFFHLFYDPVPMQYGYQIDNGAIVYLPTVVTPPSTATGSVGLAQTYNSGAGGVIYDELGIITTRMLTADELTFLFNNGAGKTWPFP